MIDRRALLSSLALLPTLSSRTPYFTTVVVLAQSAALALAWPLHRK